MINRKYAGAVTIHQDPMMPENLAALFRFSPYMLVSSLCDGMNVVGMEYAASKYDQNGVLLLSEKTGAAKSMKNGPVIIDPTIRENVSQSLERAFRMTGDEKRYRLDIMRRHLAGYTVHDWNRNRIEAASDIKKRKTKYHLPDIHHLYEESEICIS
jgi:trehalose-6-phosphate synthase